MDSIEVLLSRDAAWRPPRAELAAWLEEAARAGGPPQLLQEARWWEAHEAALAGDWDRVTALAAEGLADRFSERESIRLALLHVRSGDVARAQHVLAQAIQWRSDESLLRRFAELCEAEALPAAAAAFRRFATPRR